MVSFDLICQQVLNKLVQMISEPKKMERQATRQSRWDIPAALPNTEATYASPLENRGPITINIETSVASDPDKIDKQATLERPSEEFTSALKRATSKVEQRKAQVSKASIFAVYSGIEKKRTTAEMK